MTDLNKPRTWAEEDEYWRSNYRTRPYAAKESDYAGFRDAYRYGYDSAHRYHGRSWNDVEPELSRNWSSYEHRGSSTWEHIKHAVRDAWDRVTGHSMVTK